MVDAAGSENRPWAGWENCVEICERGKLTDHYYHLNQQTRRFEVVKRMPEGVPDFVVQRFDSFYDAKEWVGRHRHNFKIWTGAEDPH